MLPLWELYILYNQLFGEPGNVREIDSCWGIVGNVLSRKLSIAYFKFGAMSVFSKLLQALHCHFKEFF